MRGSRSGPRAAPRPLAALGCMPGRAGGNRAGLTAPCARGAWACAHSGLRQQPPAGACPRQHLPSCICEGWLAVLPYRCRKSVWVNVSGSGPVAQSGVWPTGGEGPFLGVEAAVSLVAARLGHAGECLMRLGVFGLRSRRTITPCTSRTLCQEHWLAHGHARQPDGQW